MAKPFIKWAGGKKVILKTLVENLPKRSITDYYEPFAGGGALFFSIRNSDIVSANCFLNDINKPLINTYRQIRDNLDEVIDYLKLYKYDFEAYYLRRKLFSENKLENNSLQAARFIYLNKCGFNGLYRENKKGEFNVPFGKYSKVNICDEKTLREASGALQGNVYLSSTSFNKVFENITNPDGTFVYFDPPYYKEKGNSFTNYTGYGFDVEDQVLLKNCVDFLSCGGVSVMISNSDTMFIRELYKGYNLIEVVSRRSINRDGSNRKPKTELLIRNY
jgi:DNA adenine methylase